MATLPTSFPRDDVLAAGVSRPHKTNAQGHAFFTAIHSVLLVDMLSEVVEMHLGRSASARRVAGGKGIETRLMLPHCGSSNVFGEV